MAKHKTNTQEPDEFLEALKRGYMYVRENIKFVSMIAGGILAAVLIILFVLYQVKSARIQEATALDNAVSAFHQGRLKDALEFLKAFSGKEDLAAARAEMYRGNIFYDQAKYKEALQHYQAALKIARSKKIEVVQDLAHQGIADTELALGHPDQAEAAFHKVGERFRDFALLELGRIYAAQGKIRKAVKALDDLINNYSDSPWVPAAKELKGQLVP
ncbi:MAG: tetratricopeptide repeat protein [Deltaproteobacteria bacterium]|nr:tetratricopeptide repeat protein [Deltaproteobacteria bacterium]